MIFGQLYRQLFQALPRKKFGFMVDVFEKVIVENWTCGSFLLYSLGVWFVITHMGLGLRVLLAHQVSSTAADRVAWAVHSGGVRRDDHRRPAERPRCLIT